MLKINARMHGILDYVLVVLLWISPVLFSLPPVTSRFTYILGGIHLLLTIFTDFKVGLVKIVPLKIHRTIELLVSLLLIVAAFILGNHEGATTGIFLVSVAVIVFITWLLTDYNVKS